MEKDEIRKLEMSWKEQSENGVRFEQLWADSKGQYVRPEYAGDWTRECDRFFVGFAELCINVGFGKIPPDAGDWITTRLPKRYADLLHNAVASLQPPENF